MAIAAAFRWLGAKTGRRLTVRLDNGAYEKLRKRGQEFGLDSSFMVREAIGRYLDGESTGPTEKAAASPVLPQEAFQLTPRYLAWSGDLRDELRRRFVELVAVAHVTAAHWPKSKGVREVYVALLSACKYLGIGDAVRHG